MIANICKFRHRWYNLVYNTIEYMKALIGTSTAW